MPQDEGAVENELVAQFGQEPGTRTLARGEVSLQNRLPRFVGGTLSAEEQPLWTRTSPLSS